MQRKNIQKTAVSQVVPLKQIVPNAWNKRGDEGIPELAASIAARGLLEEIVVRPVGSKFEIVAGERRWRACLHNRAKDIRCHVMEIDEATARAITFVENAERKKLTPFEEAEEIAGMASEEAGAEEIAAHIGRPTAFVRRRLALRVLDMAGIAALADASGMEVEQVPLLALELLAAAPEQKRDNLPPWALESVTNMRRWLLADRLAVAKAPWAKKERFIGLLPCAECPKRTGAEGSLFPELEAGTEDLCLDGDCWAKKARATVIFLADTQRAAGKDVLLIGDDFDTSAAQDAGVIRRSDCAPAKKGEKGAVLALAWDGADAGKAIWVRPPPEPKPLAKAQAISPDRKKWRWIAKEAALRVDERLGRGADGGQPIDWRGACESLLRFGVESRGLDYVLPTANSEAVAEIELGIGPGISAFLGQVGRPDGNEAADRGDVHMLLAALFGGDAVDLLEELERGWDEVAGKSAGQSKSRKQRG